MIGDALSSNAFVRFFFPLSTKRETQQERRRVRRKEAEGMDGNEPRGEIVSASRLVNESFTLPFVVIWQIRRSHTSQGCSYVFPRLKLPPSIDHYKHDTATAKNYYCYMLHCSFHQSAFRDLSGMFRKEIELSL